MQEAALNAANQSLYHGSNELITMYTNTALILNACDLAAKGYAKRTDDFQLSTTVNIPEPLRLPLEVDKALHRDELPKVYSNEVLERISEDFLIRIVSLLDDTFEDIYAKLLAIYQPELTDKLIEKKVRGAWGQDDNGHVRLVNFLIDDTKLISPKGKKSTVEMVFERYYELREIRHAVIHSAGVLSDKHLKRLSELAEKLPEDLKGGSLAKAGFIQTGIVKPGVNDVLTIRHWAYTTIIGYLQQAFKESFEHNQE